MENCAKNPGLSSEDRDFLAVLAQNLNLIDSRAHSKFSGDRLEILTLITSSYREVVRLMLLEPDAVNSFSIADFSENAAITLMLSSNSARQNANEAFIDRQMKAQAAMISERMNVVPADQSEFVQNGEIVVPLEYIGVKKDSVFKKAIARIKGTFTKTSGV